MLAGYQGYLQTDAYEEDTTGMKKIGEEITETLEYTTASLVKKMLASDYLQADESLEKIEEALFGYLR